MLRLWSVRANRIAHRPNTRQELAPRRQLRCALGAKCLVRSWISSLSGVPLDEHSIEKIQDRSSASLGMPDSRPRGLRTAELGGERFDLAARRFERAGTVDFFGGEKKFFFDGKLGGDAPAGFAFAEAAREKALELLFRRTPGDYEAVEFFVNARFDQQRGFDENRIANPGALPGLELAENSFSDARMDDGVEAVEFGAIVEDDGAEFYAIHAAPGCDHGLAEFLEDFIVGGLAGLDELVGEGVGVEDGEPHFAQHGGDGAFAARHFTGKGEWEDIFLGIARRHAIGGVHILVDGFGSGGV